MSHRNRLLHMLWLAIWRREKKQSMEQLVVAPSTGPSHCGEAQEMHRMVLHIIDNMAHTRTMS